MPEQQKVNDEDLHIETRNSLLITVGLAAIFVLASLQQLVIVSYDMTLIQVGISPLVSTIHL